MKLVLLRHGQSTWNLQNRFTGWTNVPLTTLGKKEAAESGKLLKKAGIRFDVVYTSVMKRASATTEIALKEMGQKPRIVRDWRLNERHYGALQGLNKSKMAHRFGEKQVHIWRRSYSIRPPAMNRTDKRFQAQFKNYPFVPNSKQPLTECLKDTVIRLMPLWKSKIIPSLKRGDFVLVSAHGNSLRAIVMFLDKVPEKDIVNLTIPTGVPLVYELDSKLRPIRHYYLGDPKEIAKRMAVVEKQGKAK